VQPVIDNMSVMPRL